MRKVFLEDLPHNKSQIDWEKGIGYKVKFIYDDIKGEVKIYDYKNKYLYVKYLNKDIFKIYIGNFMRCCFGKLLSKYTGEFKIKIGTSFKDDKRDIIIVNKEYRFNEGGHGQDIKYYKYKCNKCGYDEGWIMESNLSKGIGCSCCSNTIVVEGINDIPTTAPWMIKYFQGGYNEAKLYNKNSNKKIYPVCPDCGKIKDKVKGISDIYKNHSIGCICGDGKSYPEKFMNSILEQLDINFVTEYSPNWAKLKRYDFYFELDSEKYIVEMDGSFHFRDNKMNGCTKKNTKEIDNYKDKLAKKYGIKIIRINSEISNLNYIKNNVINSSLNNILDMGKIDWLKCEESALSNLVKRVCKLKRNSPNITTAQISEITKLNIETIRKYLNMGKKLGWCDYCGNGYKKATIICLNTEEIFNSISEACKKYNIHNSNLSECCKTEYKSAGKDPISGERLRWAYYNDEYIKLHGEVNTDNVDNIIIKN